ncbi:MAG: response regulator transcription factor [Planctomycetes bacterium]|nr:response regulator transcription factor [Planctomycetota bacterium]
MKPKEIETCREAFDLYVKGYRIEYKQGDPKGYFKEFAKAAKVSPDTITRAVQVHLDQETKLFEKLKKVIPQNIIKQIDTSNNRCFLIVGKDEDLIDGIVSYVLHASKFKARLLYENCTPWNVNRITPLVSKFLGGNALFLRNVYTQHIKHLAEIVRDNERRDIHGYLFVSIKTLSKSEDFGKHFEKICLETTISFEEKTLTVTVNGKKYTNFQDYEYKLCKLLYENKGVLVNYEKIKKEVFCSKTEMPQIHNTKSSIEKKLNGCVNIESKRGIGYMMTV